MDPNTNIEQKRSSQGVSYLGVGAAIGIGLGTALGVALGSIAVWTAMGAAVGVAFGAILTRRIKSHRR